MTMLMAMIARATSKPMTERESETKLLPCPFCGASKVGIGASQEMDEAGNYIEELREWSVICSNCGASNSLHNKSEAEAAATWNTRAALSQPSGSGVAEIERLKRQLATYHAGCNAIRNERNAAQDVNERLRVGIEAAIRAATLALFVIRKQDVMPNSSWEAGFKRDMATAEAAASPSEGQAARDAGLEEEENERLRAALKEIQAYSVGDPRPRHTWYYDRAEAALKSTPPKGSGNESR